MVGCVLEKNGEIIGEGFHRQFGGPHAEVEAVRSVGRESQSLEGTTAYVTLEPCSHFGKTPPCADLLINRKVDRVVVANIDPNPLVAGRGIRKLQEAGIAVATGLLARDGGFLNRRFFTAMTSQRPYIVLKWAETADGFIARTNFDSKWISGPFARKLVHQWRHEEQAIMVGTQTALYDNPRLNVRDYPGKDPVRVVIDRHLRLPPGLHFADGSQPTYVFNLKKNESLPNLTYVQLEAGGFLQQAMEHLFRAGIHSVMVEGGSGLLQALIDLGLWDEARVVKSPGVFGSGIKAPAISGMLYGREKIGTDELSVLFHPAQPVLY
jgi:diaminohydroxyphosphoribosylaminopyrimidine deaminase/5-amino-6-(5-phosphoribosylamino)uracil reductase